MRNIFTTLILVLVLGCARTQEPPPEASHMNVPVDERAPDFFEPFLDKNPDDGDHRAAALVWYDRRERNAERLKHHTFEMIERRPFNLHVFFENHWLLYSDPEYRADIINRLERKASEPDARHGTYWNLALTCKTGAISPHDGTPDGKRKFLKWYGLSDETEIVAEPNDVLVAKTVEYFRKAISLAGKDTFRVGLYSKQLAEFLAKLGRTNEAIAVLETSLTHSKKHRARKDSRSLVENQNQELRNLIDEIKEGPTG